VILRDGQALAFDELKKFLMAKEIAKYKIPERLELMPDFPVSTFGKVSKKKLAEMVTHK
jgi:2,3-dihydroxybenzoate-AMP ligase